VFKRGMRGVYQHCSEKHLHRYLAEFDFRYNNRAALGVNDGDARRRTGQGHRRQAPHLSTASSRQPSNKRPQRLARYLRKNPKKRKVKRIWVR
jgi:hypothetical protein